MRRLAALLLILALCLVGFAEDDVVYTTDQLTGSGVVLNVPGYYYGISVTTDGSNTATIVLYDNASAGSGKKITQDLVFPSSSTRRMETFEEDPPVALEKGIYAVVTCAGTVKFAIHYRRQ